MQTKINLKDLPKVVNKSFYPLMTNKDRWLILIGGAGSGKSFFATQKWLVRIMKAAAEGRSHRFLCLRKTQPAARKSLLALYRECISVFGLSDSVQINKTDMTITLFGSEIIITGMDDEEKIKSIHGISGIWLEEATEFTHRDFLQLDIRLRGLLPDYKQIILSFNPIDEQHWIRQELFDDALQAELEAAIKDGTKIVRRVFTTMVDDKPIETAMTVMHSDCDDNDFIDPEYKAVLVRLGEQDLNFYKVYRLGMWGVLKGLIFENWEITKEWPAKPDDGGFGLDFGFTTDPSGLVELAFMGNTVYIREKLYETGLTNSDISDRLDTIIPPAPHSIIVADCAEPKSIAEIRQRNHHVIPCQKGPDSINHGIQRMKQFIMLIDYNSPNLIKELQSYKWAENKDGTPKHKPVDYNNHLIDAARYCLTKLKGKTIISIDVTSGETPLRGIKEGDFDPPEGEPMVDIDDPAIWNDV